MPDLGLERIRAGAGVFLVGALLVALAATAAVAQGVPPERQADYDLAARTILCDCGCHPQSVHECACGRAAEMRREIGGMVARGMTGEEIIAAYVERHGEQIRIAPVARGFNLVAWLGPLVGLVVASFLVFLLVRRWSRRSEVEPLPPTPDATPASSEDDSAYRARLRRSLEEWS